MWALVIGGDLVIIVGYETEIIFVGYSGWFVVGGEWL
jgi:hypothetical protein